MKNENPLKFEEVNGRRLSERLWYSDFVHGFRIISSKLTTSEFGMLKKNYIFVNCI